MKYTTAYRKYGTGLPVWFALLLVFLPAMLKAKIETYTATPLIGSAITPGAVLNVQDAQYQANNTWYANIPLQKVQNTIVLRFDPDNQVYIACNYTAVVQYQITWYDKDGNPTNIANTQLTVEYNNDRGVTHPDLVYHKFTGAHRVDLTVLSVNVTYASGGCSGTPANLLLENTIEIERYFDFNPNATGSFIGCPPPNAPLTQGCRYDAATNEMVVEWNAMPGAEEYDLEWLFVNNYDGTTGGALPPNALQFNFKYNSTRIQTTETSYRIPAIFEQGYVLFRLRGIGRGSPLFDVPIAGAWTITDGLMTNPAFFCHFRIGGPNLNDPPVHESDRMNWQYSASYAEAGKNKVANTYYDGSLRNRQAVSKLNTEQQAIAGETIYDAQGRGAVQVLPTPTKDPVIKYYDLYNRPDNTPTIPYNYQHFDLDLPGISCAVEAEPMSTQSGASNYYSPANTDQSGAQAYVPDAFKFPFSQIEYTPDNTGRIRRQSGVGVDHQLGSGHETKYFYGKPSQEHLDRLFGHEVGFFSHYKKNAVIDANGQISVSYLDQQGRAVATALAGDSPQNLIPLDSNKEQNPDPMTINLLDNRPLLPGGDALESNYTYLATSKGDHEFAYALDDIDFKPECLVDACYDCVYEFIISIKDECGVEVGKNILPGGPTTTDPIRATIGPMTGGSVELNDQCVAVDFDQGFTAYLQVGNYSISKTLRVNLDALNFYLDDYLTRESCVIPLDHFIQDEFAHTDFTLCDPADDCQRICEIQLGPDATAAEIEACKQDCEFADPCEAGRLAMVADFYPGGQYATFTDITTGPPTMPEYAASDYFSILTVGSPYYAAHGITGYNDPAIQYKDASGAAAMVTLPDGSVVMPNNLSVTQFVLYFQPSWAEALANYHPEYCDWVWCSSINRPSDLFDHQMQSTTTYQEALALGLLNPLNQAGAPVPQPGQMDPFFTSPFGAPYLSAMASYMFSYIVDDPNNPGNPKTFNLWQLAAASVVCNDPDITTPQQKETCIDGVLAGSVTFAPFSATDPCVNDRIWEVFRGLYLGKKMEFVDASKLCGPPPNTKEERFPDFTTMMTGAGLPGLYGGDPNVLTGEATALTGTAIEDACQSQCESYADMWMQKLSGCLANATANDLLVLREKLIQICQAGCDGNNPLGASSVPPGHPGIPSLYGGEPNYMNFNDAIESIAGPATITCNGDLINMPLPYGHDYPGMTVGGNLDDCGCDKILEAEQLYQSYLNGGGLPPSIPDFMALFQIIYGVEVENLQGKACICRKAFEKGGSPWSPGGVWTQAALDYLLASGEFAPAGIGCTHCAGCEEVRKHYIVKRQGIENEYYAGGPIPAADLYLAEAMIATHLNGLFNLNFSHADYEEFLVRCDTAIFYCGDLTTEALDLAKLLDLLVDPVATQHNGGQAHLVTFDCLCQAPYSTFPADPNFPVTPQNASSYYQFLHTPPYTNSLVDHIDPAFNWTYTACDHYYTFDNISGNTLTGFIYSESNVGDACTLTLEFTQPGFNFDNIIAFLNIQPDPDYLTVGVNRHFLIDAKVIVGGSVVTTTLKGYTTCFPIVECFEGAITLCEDPEPETPEDDPCTTALENTAITNATNAYTTYIEQVKAEFRAAYIDKCLSAAERFTMKFQDNEYHYTLYYYDQAGNLIKTVPPEGVELLTDQTCVDKAATDRAGNSHDLFTKHRMSTGYQYNSLNQLVTQHMPDHDDFDNWKNTLITPLDPNLEILDIDFSSANDGYFIATDPANPAKSRFYNTTDGGDTWTHTSANNIILGDFNAIQFLNVNLGYAVGDNALMLKTDDGGNNWCLVVTGATKDLVDLFFKSNQTEGLVFDRFGHSFKTNDGGTNWTPGASIPLTELEDVHFSDDLNGFAVGKKDLGGGLEEGVVFRTTDGGNSWTQQQNVRATAFRSVQLFSQDEGVAVGADGNLWVLKTGFTGWFEAATHFAQPLVDLHFPSPGSGIALGQNGTLYGAALSGLAATLSPVSGAPSNIKDLYFATGSRGYALAGTSNPKVYQTTTGGSAWTLLNTLSLPSGFNPNTLMADETSLSDIMLFFGNNTGTVIGYKKLGSSWIPTNIAPNVPSSIKAVHVQATPMGSTFSVQNAAALLQGGPLYWKNNNTAWTNTGPALFTDMHFIDISNGFAVSANGQVWKTVDAGQNWSQLTSVTPASGNSITGIWFLNGATGCVWGEKGEYFQTANGGTSWISLSVKMHPLPLKGVFAQNSNSAYVSGLDGTVLKTTNGGITWQTLPAGIVQDLKTVGFYNNTSGYAAGTVGFTYKTTTAGASWNPDNTGSTADWNAIGFTNFQNGFLVGAGGNIRRQSASGGAWGPSPSGTTQALNAISKTSDNQKLFAAGDAGTILYTADGGASWIVKNAQVQPEKLLAAYQVPGSPVGYAVGIDGMVLKTQDGGFTWTPLPTSFTEDLHGVHFLDINRGVAVGKNGTVIYTLNGGVDWYAAITGGATANFKDVAFTTSGNVGFAVGENAAIYRSTDLQNWTQQTPPAIGNRDLYAVELKDRVGYISGRNGTLLKTEDCDAPLTNWFKLVADNGQRWDIFNTGQHYDLYDIKFLDRETGYAVGENHIILKTIDGGTRWTQRDATGPGNLYTMHLKDANVTAFLGGNNSWLSKLEDGTDRFSTRFWYDRLGRLVSSQNARQFARNPQRYSYTRYDALGRIVEVGEIEDQAGTGPEPHLNAANYPGNWNATRYEVTRTRYDEPLVIPSVYFLQNIQKNLRGRVASAMYYDVYTGFGDDGYTNATHYSYDIHGNVNILLQENRDLPHLDQRFKRIEYDYDLVSGNVNEVRYQPGQCDQFAHRYTYDADNRILAVFTSVDGTQWDRDAAYEYYQHGPLARTEIGDNRVQGVDYAYTIQGWMAGVNSNTLHPNRDIGKDGRQFNTTNGPVGRDAYGFSLGYYQDDYQAIGGSLANKFKAQVNGTPFGNASPGLYNGNIRHMVTGLTDPQGNQLDVQGTAYHYDQLNRLRGMTAYSGPNIANTNSFSGVSAGNQYATAYQYDANGNLEQLKRDGGGSGNPQAMDDMTYRYTLFGGHKINNRLYQVNDAVPAANYSQATNGTEDIDDQGAFNPAHPFDWNYGYDETGNLVRDKAEQIERIDWTVYGKIKRIARTSNNHDKPDLEFAYDATGNRLMKLVKPRTAGVLSPQKDWTYTYYVRDAQGNVLAIYKRKVNEVTGAPNAYRDQFALEERYIYGSSRLGVQKSPKQLGTFHLTALGTNLDGTYIPDPANSYYQADHCGIFHERIAGLKEYELTNHLGNVLVTVSDRKMAVSNGSAVGFYLGDLSGVSDYYPFGMGMPGRASGGGRFGFQGQEKDNELFGKNNFLSFTFRVYDTRIGRFLSVDPLGNKYPYNSSYSFAENKLGSGIELEGLELGPMILPTSSPLLGVSDVVIMEGTVGRTPIIRPVIEATVETNVSRPTGGPWWNILRYGSRVHKEQLGRWAKQGFEVEKWLGRLGGKGNRADGLKIERLSNGEKLGTLRELKPNTEWGRSAGIQQLSRYLQAAQQKYPDVGEWIQELHLYENNNLITGLFYSVQEGDNLSKIAEKFNTTIENIALINNISDVNKIKTGEEILIDFAITKTPKVDYNFAPADATNVAPSHIYFDTKVNENEQKK